MARGRPRKTDPEEALDAAMKLFWRKGFDGTSLQDLVAVTGMAKPGLYAAFGDKEALYEKTMEHYIEAYGCPLLTYLEGLQGSLREIMAGYLGRIADTVSNPVNPCGCYIVNGMVDRGNRPHAFERLWQIFDRKRLDALKYQIEAAAARGELAAHQTPETLAQYFAGQAMALAVMGRAGGQRDELQAFIETALGVLPETPAP